MLDKDLLTAKTEVFSKLNIMFNQHYVHSNHVNTRLCMDISNARDNIALSIKNSQEERSLKDIEDFKKTFNIVFNAWKEQIKESNNTDDEVTKRLLNKGSEDSVKACISLSRSIANP